MKIFSYEDRTTDIIGIKLLVLSLRRHCPGLEIEITFPRAPAELVRWFAERPGATLRTEWTGGPRRNGWNIKPHLLLQALDQGAGEAVWIDTDILLTADVRRLLAGLDDRTIGICQEYLNAPLQGGTTRTMDWNLEVGRSLPVTVNSAILRVTEAHRPLLQAWDDLMLSDRYQDAQSRPWHVRSLAMLSDQDVLTALLGSRRFADLPIHWIRRGTDIAQCFHFGGYLAHERLMNLVRRSTPAALHTQGVKPWRDPNGTLHCQLSPYTLEAREYKRELEPGQLDWAEPKSALAQLLCGLSGYDRSGAGLLPSLLQELRYQFVPRAWLRKMLGIP